FDEAVGGGRVLDVGCNPGWETATFARRGDDVVGIDLAETFCRRTADRVPDAGVARMDMRHLGVPTDGVDGVWALASLVHVPRDQVSGVLSEFARVLRPGGTLLVAVKAGEGTTRGDTYPGDERTVTLFEADELRALLAEAGFAASLLGDDEWIRFLGRTESLR
ncbi:MAG: class I SAM-dependent methyltransferase, partial [Halobacteriales archaeon]